MSAQGAETFPRNVSCTDHVLSIPGTKRTQCKPSQNSDTLSDIWKSLYRSSSHNATAYTTTEISIKNCNNYQNHYRIWTKKRFQETISKHMEISIFDHKNNLIKKWLNALTWNLYTKMLNFMFFTPCIVI